LELKGAEVTKASIATACYETAEEHA